jgi:putative aldouronate transport system substrate-binding protein
VSFSVLYGTYVSQGMLLPLDDAIAAKGPDITRVMGDYLKAGEYNDQIYVVPVLQGFPQAQGILFRNDIAQKYGFNKDNIKTIDDIERLYTAVKAGEPSTMAGAFTLGSTSTPLVALYSNWDPLGGGVGVLLNNGQDVPFKVVNLFETDYYKNALAKVYDWQQKGFFLPDATSQQQQGYPLIQADRLFSILRILAPGADSEAEMGTGYDMEQANILPGFVTTSNVSIGWCVPITCKDVNAAVEFMNWMWRDDDTTVLNLLDWGIEGKHYVKVSENRIKYPDGVDASNSGYNLQSPYMIGNQTAAYVWESYPDDYGQVLRNWNNQGIMSKAFGFVFNPTPVSNETSAVTNVLNQYQTALEWGLSDIDSTLAQMNADLKAAGLDAIIAEKQRQLDEWAHQQGLY